jgi:MFS family permease
VAALAPREVRHRATAVSRVAANVGFGLGGAIGGLVAVHGTPGFIALFAGNAVTSVLYALVLLVVAVPPILGRAERGYAVVFRDKAFLRLVAINVAMIAVGWSVFTWLLPLYAQGTLAVDPQGIGLLALANASTVVVCQVPIARYAEGRRRVLLLAAGAVLFVLACGLVVAAGGRWAYAVLMAAAILVGLGECLHTSVLMPLVADLAPVESRGRYMAAMGLSWWIGLAVAPTLGPPLMTASPSAVFVVAAMVAAVAGVAAMGLERRLPAAAVRTPVPHA